MAYIRQPTAPSGSHNSNLNTSDAAHERLADISNISGTTRRNILWEATDKELRLQARCADLEYQLAVRNDELKDVTRERDRFKAQLDQMMSLNKARQEAVDAIAGGEMSINRSASGREGGGADGIAGRTLRDIERASLALNKTANGTDAAAGLSAILGNFSASLGSPSLKNIIHSSTNVNPEEVYRLQTALIEATEAKSDLEMQLQKTQAALKVIQNTAIEEVGKAKMDIEKEVISLKKQLEAATAKNQDMKRSVIAADQVLASEFQLEGMSQFVSHSVLVPSETVFQRLRAAYRNNNKSATNTTNNVSAFYHNNVSSALGGINSSDMSMAGSGGGGGGIFQAKYDVNVEFSSATRSIILKGKRLCVELLKGELYATLNALTTAQVAAATGAPTGNSIGQNQLLTTPGLGNVGGISGRQIGNSNKKDVAAEVDHLCRTISTHEATIAALHTAIQHAQDRAKLADAQTEEAKLHVSFVEEKMKQTQILCTAKEREFSTESSNLREQLRFAEEKVEKALKSLQDEASVSSHYRDENDKLREELEQVLAAKEMSDRTGYVASEQVKALTTRAEEATKTASLAIADKEHADRLQKEIVKVRAEAEAKTDRLSQEVGQLQFQLREKETTAADIQRRFKDYEIALETSNTEIEVQRELINELRNRLLLALNAGGGVGMTGPAQMGGSGSTSVPVLGKMSNAELLQKLSVPVTEKRDENATSDTSQRVRSRAASGIVSGDGGLNMTPRAGGGGGNYNTSTTNMSSFQPHNGASATKGAVIAAVPNDTLTMQVIEDLYVENDALKAELAQAHRDIREVAHALKETREVREQSVKEVERLQMEKQKWTEERVAAQRSRMEEQLLVRQKAAEYELVIATLEDQLAQTKARCEVLQKKLTGATAGNINMSAAPPAPAAAVDLPPTMGTTSTSAGNYSNILSSHHHQYSPNTKSAVASTRLAALAEGSLARPDTHSTTTTLPNDNNSASSTALQSNHRSATRLAAEEGNRNFGSRSYIQGGGYFSNLNFSSQPTTTPVSAPTVASGSSWLTGLAPARQEPSVDQPNSYPPQPSSRFL